MTVGMREIYCNVLQEVARKDSKVVSINCDLCSSMGMVAFEKEFPMRSFNVGVQEANGCGIAAGLSAVGFVPFLHTFAAFATRRIYDQVFISCAYAGLNVKIIGGDGGISATYNGGTHMAFEDIGIMRCVPNITVIEPSDVMMIAQLVPQIAQKYGVFYMRYPRKQVIQIYDKGAEFNIGKAVNLRGGHDVTLIASGMTVNEALKASDILAKGGISARVVDMFTIKPIDKECIIECAMETGAIVTVENHSIYNGLGSAVAEVLVEVCPAPMERVGVQDLFGEVGDQDYLMERFGLTAKIICEKAMHAISRKS